MTPSSARPSPAARRLGPTLFAAATLALGGCAVSPRDNPQVYEAARTQNRPVLPPTRSVSGFSDSLACMDHMLLDYRVPKVRVTSKIIPDVTGKINVATKDMIITAFSTMSRTSGAFRYVDYEVDALKQDTVQNMTTLLLNAGQMQLQKPQLYVSGSLSYMDQNVVIQRMGGGASAANWEFGFTKDYFGSAFGMELHLGDFNTRTLLPGVDAANEIIVANAGRGVDLGGRIRKTGVQFNLGQEVSQGTGPAVRTLVELGLVELVGKWARVPYWQCLALDQTHPEFQYQLRDWWNEMPGEERVRLFQTGLRNQQYFAGPVDGRPSPALREALSRYQADQHLVVSGNLGFEAYERLVRDYVSFDGAGQFVRVGWAAPDKRVAAAHGAAAVVAPNAKELAATAPRQGQPAFDSTQAKPVKVNLDVNDSDGAVSVGTALVASVSTDRQAWLQCYYQDSRGRVSQIYPNPLQRRQPLQANLAISIPDAGVGAGFSIVANKPGPEEVGCFASDRDLSPKLPAELRGPALEPIVDMVSLADVQKAYEQGPGPAAYSIAKVRYVVKR